MNVGTFLGLLFVTGGSTVMGSLPTLFHHRFKQRHWAWWESFGGGVMISASVFSLFVPAYKMGGISALPLGIISGISFIFLIAFLIKNVTQNIYHQRAFLFVFVMSLHNVPEGLAVGVDVAALGWRESLPLTVAIFVQNLPEGLASSMSFIVAGFKVREALIANGVTAVIESLSAFLGHSFVSSSVLGLPFLLSFSGASMFSVVAREVLVKYQRGEAESISLSGFVVGLLVCGALDILL